jgi:hypothetical protein
MKKFLGLKKNNTFYWQQSEIECFFKLFSNLLNWQDLKNKDVKFHSHRHQSKNIKSIFWEFWFLTASQKMLKERRKSIEKNWKSRNQYFILTSFIESKKKN